jgi:biofilm protein TabA
MICSSLCTLDADRPTLPKAVVIGLEYLQKTDFSKMKLGRYEIDDPAMYAIVQEYQTQAKDAKKAEAHVKFIDIQFVCSGSEIIGYSPANPEAEVLEDLVSTNDVITYKTVPNETAVILTEGMYAVLFPHEIHRPQCNYMGKTKVRKVVIKVDKALLK